MPAGLKTKVMKYLLTILCAAFSIGAFAQPTVGLNSENIIISEPELSNITTELGATPYTWRVYANIPENYELQIVYGNFMGPFEITTAGSYYQHPLGGPTTLDFTQAAVDANPELAYDSWLTIGATESTGNQIQVVPVDVFDDWDAGNNLFIDDFIGGSIFMTTAGFDPQNSPDENGDVLIAQITATDIVEVCLSFQIRRLNPDGTIYTPTEVWEYNNQCITLAPPLEGDCPGDFDDSGTVAIPDVLILLVDFGCQSGCIADLTGDDKTLTDDFLAFLAVFGTVCD